MARILVVDDDRDILEFAERILGLEGYTVCTAIDAMQAMDLLNSASFDLLISDANMPVYSGFELLQTVRNNENFKHMAIAMLTGRREKKDIERALSLGVDDYIVKPIDPVVFAQKVKALFDKNPPFQPPEIKFSPGSPLAKAQIISRAQVVSISEFGIEIITSLDLSEGMVLEIKCEFFEEIGINSPPLKVVSVEASSNGPSLHAKLMFVGADEKVLSKIRGWILTHGASRKSA